MTISESEIWQAADLRSTREKMAPLIPGHKPLHLLGRHRKHVEHRAVMNAVFFVLRRGCQWSAPNATDISPSCSAHRRFQEWCDAGGVERFWQNGLRACEQLDAIDRAWLSVNGCTADRFKKNRPQSHRQRDAGGVR